MFFIILVGNTARFLCIQIYYEEMVWGLNQLATLTPYTAILN